MALKHIYSKGLDKTTHFIISEKEAAIINPLRDIDDYLALQEETDAKIKYIFLTHMHSNCITGHLALAKATGATIVLPKHTKTTFEYQNAKNGDEFAIGNLSIQFLSTPGYSIDSTSFLLKDESQKPYALFLGNLFYKNSFVYPFFIKGESSKDELATMLYGSIHDNIYSLPEDILIFHGNYNPSKQAEPSNLNQLKKEDSILNNKNKASFVKEIANEVEELTIKALEIYNKNLRGYEATEDLILQSLKPLSIDTFKNLLLEDVQILDIRPATQFTLGFISKSLSIGLDGAFENWALQLLKPEQSLVIIAEDEKDVEEAIVRLARVGVEKIEGYLENGFSNWISSNEEFDMIIDVEADEFAMDVKFDSKLVPLDVRSLEEYDAGFLSNSQHIPLHKLMDPLYMSAIDEDAHTYVYSGKGYRSVIACSILKREGFFDVRNVLGGYHEIQEQEGLVLMVPKSEDDFESFENQEE